MPLPVTARLAPTTDPGEFQRLVVDVFSRKLKLEFQAFGRAGQAQHGVDAFATRGSDELVVLQAKSGVHVGLSEIAEDVRRADAHGMPITEFWVAAGATRDARLQEGILRLSRDRLKQGKWPVNVLFWEDIVHEIAGHKDLLLKYGYLVPVEDLETAEPATQEPRIQCPRCLEWSRYGARVCVTCKAVIIYGATPRERALAFCLGAGIALTAFLCIKLDLLNRGPFALFDFLFGVGPSAMLIGGPAIALVGGLPAVWIVSRMQRNKVRFFWSQIEV